MTVPAREIPRTSRERALPVLAAELDALLEPLRALDPDWAKPTDCTGWTVQHVLGQWEGVARLRVFFRRYRVGHRRYPDRTRLAAMTQQQVDDLGGLPPATLIEMLATIGPKALTSADAPPGPPRETCSKRWRPARHRRVRQLSGCLYHHAAADGLITDADNPALKVTKPRRLPQQPHRRRHRKRPRHSHRISVESRYSIDSPMRLA
jgi:hypothetical protein